MPSIALPPARSETVQAAAARAKRDVVNQLAHVAAKLAEKCAPSIILSTDH
jgi:hypothetical protein